MAGSAGKYCLSSISGVTTPEQMAKDIQYTGSGTQVGSFCPNETQIANIIGLGLSCYMTYKMISMITDHEKFKPRKNDDLESQKPKTF